MSTVFAVWSFLQHTYGHVLCCLVFIIAYISARALLSDLAYSIHMSTCSAVWSSLQLSYEHVLCFWSFLQHTCKHVLCCLVFSMASSGFWLECFSLMWLRLCFGQPQCTCFAVWPLLWQFVSTCYSVCCLLWLIYKHDLDALQADVCARRGCLRFCGWLGGSSAN